MLAGGCSKQSQNSVVLVAHAETMLIEEAQPAFHEHFKTSFKAEQAKMLVGSDLQKWFRDHPKIYESASEAIKEVIDSRDVAGLVISGALPTPNGGGQDIVYLKRPRFGFARYLVKELDPCGDGNPATCEHCTGCSGETASGTFHTCVCTQSCDTCRSCPSCSSQASLGGDGLQKCAMRSAEAGAGEQARSSDSGAASGRH
jgi:hypothetical protein